MNKNEYDEDEFLMLSGIQHFAFCRRQWALIHIEQLWEENSHTVEGNIFHEVAHNDNKFEKNRNILISRGLRVFSRRLGVYGVCDVVEFHESNDGILLDKYPDRMYVPIPIEYKKGRPKFGDADEVQLCAQAMCLEEMLLCEIKKGYLFYGKTKHRCEVYFNEALRSRVIAICYEMHKLYSKSYTPKVKVSKKCKNCSLNSICFASLSTLKSVDSYFREFLGDDNEKNA